MGQMDHLRARFTAWSNLVKISPSNPARSLVAAETPVQRLSSLIQDFRFGTSTRLLYASRPRCQRRVRRGGPARHAATDWRAAEAPPHWPQSLKENYYFLFLARNVCSGHPPFVSQRNGANLTRMMACVSFIHCRFRCKTESLLISGKHHGRNWT
jgi:hypothetical protein